MSPGRITKVKKPDDEKPITRVHPRDEDEIITKIPQSEKKPDLSNIKLSDRKSSPEKEIKLDIKRGYEVLPDNNVRFGIKITNYSNYAISDLEVILDYTESLFKLEGDKVQKLGTIPPNIPRTVTFLLKPLGCVHNENIGAIIHYRDHTWKKHVVTMRPKEVHCVCPFLKEKVMTRAEFFDLSKSGHTAESGLNFQGIDAEQLISYLLQTCRGRHYKVDEYSIEGGKMLLLASESIGEKAIYLLTAYIIENGGLTQVMLRAVSDKSYGLNGFLNEIVDGLRHIVSTVQSAREIGVIKKEQVINIIDSVVQRTTFSSGEGAAEVNIDGSVVQRTEFNTDDSKKFEEEQLSEEREGREEQSCIGESDFDYICTACNSEVSINDKICPNCGDDISDIETNEDEINQNYQNFHEESDFDYICTACNGEVSINDKICPNCGADVSNIETDYYKKFEEELIKGREEIEEQFIKEPDKSKSPDRVIEDNKKIEFTQRSYLNTFKDIILSPGDFFSEMSKVDENKHAIKFATKNFSIIGLIFALFIGGGLGEFLGALIGVIIFGIIGLYIGGILFYILFMLVGGSGNYSGTVRILAYSSAVQILSLVPLVGFFAGLYGIWLYIIGGKHVHNLTTKKSAMAVIIPVVFCVFVYLMLLASA